MGDTIIITTSGISGSAGSVAITGSFIVSGSDGAIELSGSGTALSGAHGASSTTSGSTTFTDAAGASTSTSATGSVTSGSAGSATHGSGSSTYTDADGTTSTSATGSYTTGSGGSTSTTSGSITIEDAAGGSSGYSASGSHSTGSAGSATHGSGSSTYTSADGTTSTSATGSHMSGTSPGTTTTTAGTTTYEDTDSTTMHSPSGSHYSGSTPVSGTAGSTTVTDGTVEVTGSITISGSSPALTITAGELIVSGSSVLGSTSAHVTTVDSRLTASYGLSAPTHGISGAYISAHHHLGSEAVYTGFVEAGTYVSASTVVTGGWHKGYKFEGTLGTFGTISAVTLSGSAATLHNITLNNVAITSNAGEINLLDGAAAETIVVSKAVIYGNIGEVTGNTFKGESLQIGDFASASVFFGSNVSASTRVSGGWHQGYKFEGSYLDLVGVASASVFVGSNVSASTLVTGGLHHGHSFSGSHGYFAIMSASTFTTHVFAPATVSASSVQAATLSGSATTVHTLNGLTATEIGLLDGAAAETIVNSKAVIYGNIGEVTGSTFKGFSTATTEASASKLVGFRHDGYEFSGSSGFFAIMSASTFTTHVFAPATVSASSGEFATLSGSATTVHTLNGLTAAEIGLLDGSSAGSIVASKAVIYDAVGKITGSQVTAFGVTGTLGTFFGLLSASSLHGFSHIGGEAVYTGFVEAGTYMSASTHFTGGHVYAYGVTGSLGTFGLLSASSVQAFSHIGGEAVYTGFVEAGTHISASTHFTGGHVYTYGVTGSQLTLTHEAATPPTYATSQIRLNYDADNFAFIGVDQNGSMTIETVDANAGALGDIILIPDGTVSRFQTNAGEIDANTSAGEIVFFGTEDGSDTLAAGKLMYLATGGIWKHADADAEASAGGVLLGVALGTAIGNGILLNGYANISGTLSASPVYKLTHGAAMYVSTTAAEITQTAPTASGDTLRIVGHAVSSSTGKVIYFNPSSDWILQ